MTAALLVAAALALALVLLAEACVPDGAALAEVLTTDELELAAAEDELACDVVVELTPSVSVVLVSTVLDVPSSVVVVEVESSVVVVSVPSSVSPLGHVDAPEENVPFYR
jgi:hypothetical protein